MHRDGDVANGRPGMAKQMVASTDTLHLEPALLESADNTLAADDGQPARQALCRDRQPVDLGGHIIGDVPPFRAVLFDDQFDRLTRIGEGLLSRFAFGDDFGQCGDENGIAAFGLRMKIDGELTQGACS